MEGNRELTNNEAEQIYKRSESKEVSLALGAAFAPKHLQSVRNTEAELGFENLLVGSRQNLESGS